MKTLALTITILGLALSAEMASQSSSPFTARSQAVNQPRNFTAGLWFFSDVVHLAKSLLFLHTSQTRITRLFDLG